MSDMLARLMALAAMQSRADLSDYYTKVETDRRISDEVARIVSDAPEDFDTLKEMSDWIASHEESAAAMNSAIQANTAGVAALYAEVATKAPQSTTYTKAEVDTALAAKLNTADVDDALGSTSTNPVQNKAVQAPIARLVDAGAKNFLDISVSTLKQYNTASSAVWDGSSYTQNGITYAVNLDGTISVSGMATNTSFMVLANRTYLNTKITRGRYSISGCPTGGGSSGATYRIFCLNPNANISDGYTDTGNGYIGEFYYDDSKDCNIAIGIGKGCVITDPVVFNPMLCTAEDYAISTDCVPYTPTLRELYEMILALQNAQNG